MRDVELVVVGGGSAGMAAAAAAHENGIRDMLILERSDALGGILRQCIHNGFGLHRFNEELTGPEYAGRNIEIIAGKRIPYLLNTCVLDISADKVITAVNAESGLLHIRARSIILAMGCRERTRGALMIPGSRPAGVITAGAAQRYLNLDGYLPGKKVVILGSGDIGLIMARQFVFEGIEVKEVVELMPYSTGLTRNISQCLNDYNIPLSYSSTVIEILGRGRVSGVVVAKVDANLKPIPETARKIDCDTLLISAGLIPENELSKAAGVEMSPATKGAVVDNSLQTSIAGIFSCGNVLHVHDMVDNVSEESMEAGKNAALFLRGKLPVSDFENGIPVIEGSGVRGIVPQYVSPQSPDAMVKLMFRPRGIYKNAYITVMADGQCAARKRAMFLTPGEMNEMSVELAKLQKAHKVVVQIECDV